jgi:hypothetical protein
MEEFAAFGFRGDLASVIGRFYFGITRNPAGPVMVYGDPGADAESRDRASV